MSSSILSILALVSLAVRLLPVRRYALASHKSGRTSIFVENCATSVLMEILPMSGHKPFFFVF